MKYFVTLPYLLSMYLTSSGRGFLPLVSWDQAVSPVYIVLAAASSIQGRKGRVWYTSVLDPNRLLAGIHKKTPSQSHTKLGNSRRLFTCEEISCQKSLFLFNSTNISEQHLTTCDFTSIRVPVINVILYRVVIHVRDGKITLWGTFEMVLILVLPSELWQLVSYFIPFFYN